MKKILLLLFFTLVMKGQENALYKPTSPFVSAEATIIVPIGSLSNKFDYAQSYGFWFNINDEKSIVINAGFKVIILNNPRPINYKFNDVVYSVNSKNFGYDVGFRGTKKISISENQTKYLELGITIGFDYLDYDFPTDENDDDDNTWKNFKFFNDFTVLFAPEIKYMYKNVGVKFQYRYTPYHLIDSFESDFGSSSVSFGIVYKQ